MTGVLGALHIQMDQLSQQVMDNDTDNIYVEWWYALSLIKIDQTDYKMDGYELVEQVA